MVSYHENERPTTIELKPRINSPDMSDVHSPTITKTPLIDKSGEPKEDILHSVDLGQPIVTLNIDDVKKTHLLEEQKENLKNIIDKVEQRNLMQRGLKSSFFWWNKYQGSTNIAWYTNPWSKNFNSEKLKEELVPILVPLALYYEKAGSKDELQKLSTVLNHIKELLPKEIVNEHLKEIFT